MRDFTLHTYENLLKMIRSKGFSLITFEKYFKNKFKNKKVVILRHDVDKLPNYALDMAMIEKKLDIISSYYFRITPNSNKPSIITQIEQLGHEIGYHYEDLSMHKGNHENAIKSFEKNLEYFRQFYNVKTICMHGSPMAKWDNRDIWKYYDYKKYNIIGEPYFDLDFNKIAYLTDTGRKWNSNSENIRDKVQSSFLHNFSSTSDIIHAFKNDLMPNNIMINVHPQRWTNSHLGWFKEWTFQPVKNGIKSLLNSL
jgi:hypothetical protein